MKANAVGKISQNLMTLTVNGTSVVRFLISPPFAESQLNVIMKRECFNGFSDTQYRNRMDGDGRNERAQELLNLMLFQVFSNPLRYIQMCVLLQNALILFTKFDAPNPRYRLPRSTQSLLLNTFQVRPLCMIIVAQKSAK